jgi:hypothetical protein
MTSKLFRYAAAPLLLGGLVTPIALGGCSDDPLAATECDFVLKSRIEAFQLAVDALANVSGEIKGNIAGACIKIANDLGAEGVPADMGAQTSDDDLTTACDLASASIDAELQGGVSISLQIVGGECHVNAEAQFNCEASCQVDASCQPGSIEARCDPGELSGECSAECSGSCTVETGSVECEGGCSGTCEGMCTGTCDGMENNANCMAKCEGTCMGSCTGTCEVVAPSATCEGSCKGGCSVAYTAPQCEAELTPPSCEVDADCQAGCSGSAEIEAECTPPSITVEIEGHAELAATLEANLPAIFLLFSVQGEIVGTAAADIASKATGVFEGVVSDAGCALQYGASVGASFAGSVEASASVSVSVEASADVSGSASGG